MVQKPEASNPTPPTGDLEYAAMAFAELNVLHRARDVAAVLRACSEVLEQLHGASDFIIYLYNAAGELQDAHVHGSPARTFNISTLAELQSTTFGDPAAVIPLRLPQGEKLGLVVITQFLGHKVPSTSEEQRRLDLFREHASIAFDVALRLASLEEHHDAPEADDEGYLGALVISAGSLLALPIQQIVEVSQMVAIAGNAPDEHPGCSGVIAYRGAMIPLFDVRSCLQNRRARSELELASGYVVVLEDGARFSCAVDHLLGLLTTDEGDEVALPSMGHGGAANTAVMFQGTMVPLVKRMLRLLRRSHASSAAHARV